VAADHAFEFEAWVRDVEGDDAARRELREIERERLARQEVRGHRVGTEGVEQYESVRVGGRVAQTQTRVAEDDRDGRCGARGEVREQSRLARDADDRRVNLVERPRLARARVGRARARAAADDGHAL